MRTGVIWAALAVVFALPLLAAAFSPLLAYRSAVYITAGFAGILGMGLLLVQPLLASRRLPGLTPRQSRRLHRAAGVLLILCILVHVGGLWLTSPPDVVDALLWRSPTPFSIWGVIAMWAAFAAALLALARQHLRPRSWQRGHLALAVIVVLTTILHALQIDGTMETVSKGLLSAALLVATAILIRDRMR